MIALIQRVSSATVTVSDAVVGAIGLGLVVLLGVERHDTLDKTQRLVDKVSGYRVFSDQEGKMNLNVTQVAGSLLVISQFTLAADTQKGMRPSFSSGADPVLAQTLYQVFIQQCLAAGIATQSGRFGADMRVSLVNEGPVTFWLQV